MVQYSEEQIAAYKEAVRRDEERKEVRRQELIAKYGADNVWDTGQFTEKFEVKSFAAPSCFATDRATKITYVVQFEHYPRLYFNAVGVLY